MSADVVFPFLFKVGTPKNVQADQCEWSTCLWWASLVKMTPGLSSDTPSHVTSSGSVSPEKGPLSLPQVV